MENNIIETKGFKTNLYAIFLTIPMNEEEVTFNSLIPAVLRRGTKDLPSQQDINKKLEEMYGASFNCGVDKMGDYQVLKFYLEILNNKYLPEKQNPIKFLEDIVFNPLVENDGFKKEYVQQEKENIRKMIESRQDNRAQYSFDRCIEEMFEGEPYGIYKYGKIEDLDKINEKNLYEHYKKLLQDARIDCFSCGENIEKIHISFENNKENEIKNKLKEHTVKNKVIQEKLDVAQGKLIIGLVVPEGPKSIISVYNTILGGGANSKLFQNVREKASLAYTVGSTYVRRENAIFIKTGIESSNYEKTIDIIKKQLDEIKNGNISDDELNSSKQLLTSSLRLMNESQDSLIGYYFDQKLYGENISLNEYIKNIEEVSKEDIINIAQNISLDTVYFLSGQENK